MESLETCWSNFHLKHILRGDMSSKCMWKLLVKRSKCFRFLLFIVTKWMLIELVRENLIFWHMLDLWAETFCICLPFAYGDCDGRSPDTGPFSPISQLYRYVNVANFPVVFHLQLPGQGLENWGAWADYDVHSPLITCDKKNRCIKAHNGNPT